MNNPSARPTASEINRRGLLATGMSIACAGAVSANEPKKESKPTVRFCLNTSTVRGQNLSVPQQIDLAAQAGYDGIEPWIGDLRKYVEQGGKTAELAKRIEDAGLIVESAIGFANWIVDDPDRRQQGLESAKQDMELVAAVGGRRIAAPPAGATREAGLDLSAAAERYRKLLELGESTGVAPQLELWGFSKNLSRLGELMYVAVESGHPDACVLPDVYHIYKGGSDFAGLELIAGSRMHVFHMNDYPAEPPRETIGDADRVYPGAGVAPLGKILRTIFDNGFRGALSLELFNRDYWKQDAKAVAERGIASMKRAVAEAIA